MLFETKNLCFAYYKKPLCIKDLSFSFERNQKVCVLASKDMGKTTLLKVLCTFDTSYFGKILCDGIDLKTITDEDKKFSFLPTEPVVIKNKSIRDNIDFFCKNNDIAYISDDNLKEILKEFNLDFDINQKISKFSLFDLRKFAIARALQKMPKILFLDDQFEGLNDLELQKMKEIYFKMLQNKNLTIVFALDDRSFKFLQDNQLKNIADKFLYLCNSEVKIYNKIDDFICEKPTLDSLKFADSYETFEVELAYENQIYKLIYKDVVVCIDKKYYKNFKHLNMENYEICECVVAIKKEDSQQNISDDAVAKKLKSNDYLLYALLGGEKLL